MSGKNVGKVLLLLCAVFAIISCYPTQRPRYRRYRSGLQNRVRTVTDEDKLIQDLGYTLHNNRTAVIRFYADWCPRCQQDSAPFNVLPQKFPNTVFFKVDVDKHPRLIAEYGVRAVPTYFVLRRQTRHLTFHSAQEVENILRRR